MSSKRTQPNISLSLCCVFPPSFSLDINFNLDVSSNLIVFPFTFFLFPDLLVPFAFSLHFILSFPISIHFLPLFSLLFFLPLLPSRQMSFLQSSLVVSCIFSISGHQIPQYDLICFFCFGNSSYFSKTTEL